MAGKEEINYKGQVGLESEEIGKTKG